MSEAAALSPNPIVAAFNAVVGQIREFSQVWTQPFPVLGPTQPWLRAWQLPGPLVAPFANRLERYTARFASIMARIDAGTFRSRVRPSRAKPAAAEIAGDDTPESAGAEAADAAAGDVTGDPQPASPRYGAAAPGAEAKPVAVGLPRHFGWLAEFFPHMPTGPGATLAALHDDERLAGAVSQSPGLARMMRGMLHMMGVKDIPAVLARKPHAAPDGDSVTIDPDPIVPDIGVVSDPMAAATNSANLPVLDGQTGEPAAAGVSEPGSANAPEGGEPHNEEAQEQRAEPAAAASATLMDCGRIESVMPSDRVPLCRDPPDLPASLPHDGSPNWSVNLVRSPQDT